jgi:hypothetical protein
MATFDELAERYAQQIRIAARADRPPKTASVKIESAMAKTDSTSIKGARLVGALKTVDENLDGLVLSDTRKALTEEQRTDILRQTGIKLGLKKPERLYLMVKEASNDNFVALVSYWDAFFAELDS